MIGVNKIILVGNLGKDPDFKEANGHDAMCKFPLATSRRWTTADGERREHTEWHNVVLWGKGAEHCARYLNKGSAVYVEGRMEHREYTNKEGKKAYWPQVKAFMVGFLDRKPGSESGPGASARFTDLDATAAVTDAETEDLPF